MEDRKTHIGLFLSILFTLSILELAVYQEQHYLKVNDLGFIVPIYRHITHISLIIILIFSIFSLFAITPFSRKSYIASLIYLSALGIFQIFLLLYGALLIPLSINQYKKTWKKTENNTAISNAEYAMKCCGYYDILMSTSYNCPYSISCDNFIETARSPRQIQFCILLISSIIFELYNFFAVFDLHITEPPPSLNEFDELLLSNE